MSSDFRWWFRQGCYFGASLMAISFGMLLIAVGESQKDPFRIVVLLIVGAAVIIAGVGLLFAFAAPIADRIHNAWRGRS